MSLPFYDGQVVTAADLNSLVPSPTLASPAGASLIGFGATTVDAALLALAPPPVLSVAGKIGVVTLTVSDVAGVAALAGNAALNFNVANATGPQHAIPLAQADARYAPFGGGGGGGGVSSVGLSLPADFTISGAPITTSGTLTATRTSQASNLFLASPSASAGAPVYRTIAPADIPTLNQNTTGSAGSLSNTLPINKGGTGAATAQLAMNAISQVASAITGQVLTKDAGGNAIFKTPTGGGGGGLTIAVLGDSLSYPGAERRLHWPGLLQESLRSMGINVTVVNLAVSGHSFYRCNTVGSFNPQTAVQQCIAMAPDLVIIMLGANDALIQVDGRNLSQIKSDASTTLNALRSGLPSAKIIYASEQAHDASNFTTSFTKNKGVVPAFFSLPTSGILANNYCPEALNTYLAPTMQSAFANLGSFDTYLKGLGFDGYFTVNLFQIARLGATMPDGLHPSSLGTMLMHAMVLKGLSGLSVVTTLFPLIARFANNITEGALLVFPNTCAVAGDGYSTNVSASNQWPEKVSLEESQTRTIDPEAWYYPYKSAFWMSPLTGSIGGRTPIIFSMQNGPPNSQAFLSLNGGAWTGLSLYTDMRGYLWFPNDYFNLGIPVGIHSIRYRVGTTATSNITLTVTA